MISPRSKPFATALRSCTRGGLWTAKPSQKCHPEPRTPIRALCSGRVPLIIDVTVTRKSTARCGANSTSGFSSFRRRSWYTLWYTTASLSTYFQCLTLPSVLSKALKILANCSLSRQRPRVRVPSSPPSLSAACKERMALPLVFCRSLCSNLDHQATQTHYHGGPTDLPHGEEKFPPGLRKTLHTSQPRLFAGTESLKNQGFDAVPIWPLTCIYSMSIK